MNEPIDHRARARSWIEDAEGEYADAPVATAASDSALIGIGHALLALVDSIDTLRLDLVAGVNMRIDTGDIKVRVDQEQSR